MSYEHFSMIYDELMDEAPYERWLTFFLREIQVHNRTAKRILDLACGTGEMSTRLYENDFDVTGVDLSEEMLSIAYEKAMNKGYMIPFYQQNMAELEGFTNFDIVVIFCDSLNYLQTEQEVINTFQSVYRALNQSGLLLFDVHSTYKISDIYRNATFAYNGDNISYIWNSFPGEHRYSIEHELTFFVFDEETEKYDRFDELHKQRTYPVQQYISWLEEVGFDILSITSDFTSEPVCDKTERVFFTVKKP